MRNIILIGLSAIVTSAALLVTSSISADEKGPEAQAQPTKNIVETAAEAGSFKTLIAAAKAAGLAEALQAKGPLTVFAPTDAAFAALPAGTVKSLLQPENKDQLQRILKFHVVSGRVLSTDLLGAASAKTLAGDAVRFGLTVQGANVTAADILCSNGVIHVVDSVLLPPAQKKDTGSVDDLRLRDVLAAAIDRGVPAYNDGRESECAGIYRQAVRQALSMNDIASLHRRVLTAALTAPAKDGAAEAWNLRAAFDQILGDLAFEARIEAPLPAGFPGAGPVGRVIQKSYPAYRAAKSDGGRAFWNLFDHIKKNDIAMTAPVETTMESNGDGWARMLDMSFLYERPDQGAAGKSGPVDVIDKQPVTVLSIGMRGRRTEAGLEMAKKAVEDQFAKDTTLRVAGPWRALGYNSPMVPADQQYWELQVPVSRTSHTVPGSIRRL